MSLGPVTGDRCKSGPLFFDLALTAVSRVANCGDPDVESGIDSRELLVLVRRLVVWLTTIGVFAGLAAAVSTSAQAEETTGALAGGTFVPVTPTRLYEWGGIAAKKATPAAPKTVQVTGVAGIPTTGVSAVVLDISAVSTTGITNVYLRRTANESTGSVLAVGDDAGVGTNTAIVQPSAAGTVTVATRDQPVGFNLDVQGYFTTENAEGQAGGFVPITPTRLVGTHTGTGLPQAKLNSGVTYTAQIAGLADIPADATAVFANVRVVNTSVDGAAWIQAAGSTMSGGVTTVSYEAGESNDTGMTIKLGTGETNAGKIGIKLRDGVGDVIIDVQGYFTGAGESGGGFTPVVQTHIYDSRPSYGGDGIIEPGEEREVQIAGLGGVPEDGTAGSVALTVTALDWTAQGSLSVYNADLENSNGTSNVSWYGTFTGEPEYSTSIVELSIDGTVMLRNNTTGNVHVILTA